MSNNSDNRREVSSRKIHFFHNLASWLVSRGFCPNQISIMSSVFSLGAGLALFFLGSTNQSIIWLGISAVIFIQLRLICNLIDGLMAVEGGLKTPTGELYNDIPDRVSDTLIFVLLGYGLKDYSVYAVHLGWIVALGAIFTAYIRVLGASMGSGHFFSGPMAKQHRMFILTAGIIAWVVEIKIIGSSNIILGALFLIAVGTLITCVVRLNNIVKKLNFRS